MVKEHTVTIIFREGARFLPRKVKDDLVRAYKDARVQDRSFEAASFSSGRVKVESPNVVSYVAKSRVIASWLVLKARDEITIGANVYKLDFKPWLSKVQLREQRREEDELSFWVIAVQVPLDSFFYLEAQISKAIGQVTRTHPTEPDRLKPSLVNIKFDLDPAARPNMKDKIWVETAEGDSLEVKLASLDTPKCRRCRAVFHTESECRRNPRQQQAGSLQPQGGGQQPFTGQGYSGPMGPLGLSPSMAALHSTSAPAPPGNQSFASAQFNPVFSPANQGFHGGPQPQPGPFQGYQTWTGNAFLPWMLHQGHQQTGTPLSFGVPSFQQGPLGVFPSVGGFLGAGDPQPSLGGAGGVASSAVGGGLGAGVPSGSPLRTGNCAGGALPRDGSMAQGGPNASSSAAPRPRSITPGKQRRLDLEGSFISGDLRSEGSASSNPRSEDSQGRIKEVGTSGSSAAKRKAPTSLGRGQLQQVENRILPLFCTATRNALWVVAWAATDGVSQLVSIPGPEQPMPSAIAVLVRTVRLLGFTSIYAPVDGRARSQFFQELLLIVPEADKFVFAGDWNTTLDATAPRSTNDKLSLLSVMEAFDLIDPYRLSHPELPGYTWFSHYRENTGVTKRRLDFFLTSSNVWESISRVGLSSGSFSDHKPIIISLHTAVASRGKGLFRFNTVNLKEPGLVEWMNQFWLDWKTNLRNFPSMAEWWNSDSQLFSNILNIFSRLMAYQRRHKVEALKKRIQYAESRMLEHPISEKVWSKERLRLRAEWEEVEVKESEVWIERLRVRGIVVNDRMTKEAFHKLLPRQSRISMKELNHPFDQLAPVAKDLIHLCDYAALYYRDILTSRLQGADVRSDLYKTTSHWDNTTVRLSQSGKLDLDRPVTVLEAHEALKAMASGKAPGDDGLPSELFLVIWDVVGDSLVEIYNEVLLGGKLAANMSRGIISVLFKKGDKSEIRNWRPISVLNVSYKILAKVLARRLGRYLPDLVKEDQAAFIKGRSIFDNIVTTIETLEIIQDNQLDMAVLLIDLEKAYDRVNWSYVLSTLDWMGFENQGVGLCSPDGQGRLFQCNLA
ncbi:hypothetical protein CBR_g23405 [Chara braunii]|uniref:Uncharacterized protein n=1 Tax=Chara braunii TaxID=69332 RepID=A0A388L437_CHABU|nr:hypothetical protein CBR_g23405 [Chara braunii]|eukprot:GBG77079.1 hypothetical protein CBR_g23405 [Chara braunii]